MFQTSAYTSRTIKSTWNFDSSLRLMSCMFVPNFGTISYVTLVLGPENRPKSLVTKGLSTAKIFYFRICFTIPFIPTNPLLAAICFFSFFLFPFFLAISCTLFSKTTKHRNLIFVQSCWAANAILSPEFSWCQSPGNFPKMGNQKINLLNGSS